MDKNKMLHLCGQIAEAAESVISVGAGAANANGPLLTRIQQCAAQIATELNKPEAKPKEQAEPEKEVPRDG